MKIAKLGGLILALSIQIGFELNKYKRAKANTPSDPKYDFIIGLVRQLALLYVGILVIFSE